MTEMFMQQTYVQQTSYNTLEHTTTNLHYTANMLQQRKENQKLKHNQ